MMSGAVLVWRASIGGFQRTRTMKELRAAVYWTLVLCV